MKSGKTLHLINLYNKLKEDGKDVLAYKCYMDDAIIKSRASEQTIQGIPILSNTTFKVPSEETIILIDEGQNLTQRQVELLRELDNEIHIYGLRCQHSKYATSAMQSLIQICDDIEMLKCRCEKCNENNAIYNFQIDEKGEIFTKRTPSVNKWICLCHKCSKTYPRQA